MIPGVFPTRRQAEIQTRWAFQKAAQDPLVLYSLLAVSSAERSARLGELKNGSIETTFTEADLETRTVPDFVSYKLSAVKLANETMKTMETAAQASTIFAMMCLLSIEVCDAFANRANAGDSRRMRRSSQAIKRRPLHMFQDCRN